MRKRVIGLQGNPRKLTDVKMQMTKRKVVINLREIKIDFDSERRIRGRWKGVDDDEDYRIFLHTISGAR